MLPMSLPFLTSQEASTHSIRVKQGKEQLTSFNRVFSTTEELFKVVTFVKINRSRLQDDSLFVPLWQHESMETAALCENVNGPTEEAIEE